MDQNQRPSSASRAYQFHPGRAAIINLFDLYLGRSSRQKPDDSTREPPNKTQKRVVALNRELPPRNEQFLSDFEQIQSQFSDQEQLRSVTESVLISLVVQCSSHVPRAEFLLFALRSLCSIGYINWDSFLPSLLSSVSTAEMSAGQGTQAIAAVSSQPGVLPSSNTISNSSNFHSSNPASPLPSVHGIGSPAQSALEPAPCATLSPVKSSDISCTVQQSTRVNSSIRDNAISSLRQLCCKIILAGLDFNLKPVTLADIFSHMLNWLVNWDQRQQGSDESDGLKSWKPGKALIEWLHSCLDVIWLLVEEDKCRVPFYELLRSGLQFIENIPDDEALFTLILEIHRRRDMMATHMQMLDQHLHCPTFGTQRIFSQITPNVAGEAVSGLRYSPITYPSVLGEPLHGEELATSIQKGSLDWERALRCIRHAFCTTPSPDWWKRVLLVAPCYRPQAQGSTPGAVFSSEMICEGTIDRVIELLKLTNSEINCWQEWRVFSDIFYFLMKSGCIDFVDFVDKLVLRLTEGGDHHILRTNHVTLLIAEIIRIELVINALNTDARKVETTRKILSFHREDRSSDPNSPQGILLDFISSCQNLRIWSLNTSTREYLNSEQLQKGKQIDEWWRQASKGDRTMDYMKMDDRSIGMFWVVSYTMAQPACETVMNWLSSGVTELLPGSNLQASDSLMVMREVSPLPMSLLSGFSMNMCLKLAYQMEESLFSGQQVVPSIALAETYTRLLLLAPHSLFRSHFSNLAQRNPSVLSKPGVTLLVLEILNYRLLPLYRYQGKSKALMYDVTKIISALKGKRGDHRAFRLAENLCMNLILSLRDFFWVKREGKGPTEFTETLNRITVITLAIIIKTRGIADAEHLLYLQTMLEQIMGASQHTWSEKTLRYFPPVLRDALIGRMDKRGLAIQAWQQAETTVINQCKQLLSPAADPTYVMTYISHSFPQHRHYLCAGAWILMQGHPENINSGNLARVLREFSPEEVTANIYTMVDVLLHHIQLELQHGHSLQDLLLKACANLAFFVWTHELLPLDILLLALIDRDDDPHALRIVDGGHFLDSLQRACTLEAELALILRISHKYGKSGAQVLFSMGALEHIASCKAVNFLGSLRRVDTKLRKDAAVDFDGQRMIITPVLRIVFSLTSLIDTSEFLEVKNKIVREVIDFVKGHQSLFDKVLRKDISEADELAMEQINLVVGILSKVWPYEESDDCGFVQGLFGMMLALFSFDLETPSYGQSVRSQENQRKLELNRFRLCFSLSSYLYFLIRKKSLRLQISDAVSDYHASVQIQQPTLILLSSLLNSVTIALEGAAEEKSRLLNRIQDINELSRQEVDEIINMCARRDCVSSSDNIQKRRYVAMVEMCQVVGNRDQLITLLLPVAEQVLNIILIHLQDSSVTPDASGAVRTITYGSSAEPEEDISLLSGKLLPTLERLELLSEDKVSHNLKVFRRLVTSLKEMTIQKLAS